MLIGFLIRTSEDWKNWRKGVSDIRGKPVVQVADAGPPQSNNREERHCAVDDVETFDDEESDGELVERPR